MKKAGDSSRTVQERDILTNKIITEYSNKFFKINEKRTYGFFNKLREECYTLYYEKMQNIFEVAKSHFEDTDLEEIFDTVRDESLAMVCCFFSRSVNEKMSVIKFAKFYCPFYIVQKQKR